MKHAHGTMLPRAKAVRSEPTGPEGRLLYRLRAGRLNGVKFRRQVPIGQIPPISLLSPATRTMMPAERRGSNSEAIA